MEIVRQSSGDQLELRLTGRFDAAWASHVGGAIDTAVRAGAHHIAINCSAVEYISSLGLAVLLQHYKQLKAVQGRLSVVEPSAAVMAVIRAAGVSDLLVGTQGDRTRQRTGTPERIERGSGAYEMFVQAPGATLDGSLVGQPEKFATGSFAESDCCKLSLADGTLAVGLGAFGDGFADCRQRFGEFLGAGGVAVALPPAEHGVPDYVLTQGDHVPRVEVLYAVTATGAMRNMLRFDAKSDGSGVLGLSELIESSLEVTGSDAAGFVILAEAAGVVGATIRRSPAAATGVSPLQFPAVRDWLSFTTERSSDRHLVLIVGIASRRLTPDAAAFLRPLTAGSTTHGHFHTALFPYRPIPKGELTMATTLAGVLSTSQPTDVLHAMADTREFEGVGETDVMRGACWIGPLRSIARA